MIRSGSSMLHRLCGAPRVEECVDHADQCWHCGATMTRGRGVEDWMGAQFVGQSRIRGGAHLTHVCEPCVWVMSRAPGVVPDAPPLHNWRLYTVLVEGESIWRGNKADKPAILAWLRRPHAEPWFAAIADSGQKHVVPYAPINPARSRGRVQFEEQCVPIGDWQLVDDITALLTAGATKDSITRGDYGPGEWQRCGPAIRAFEQRHAPTRGVAWFALCVWLSQRDEAQVATRMQAEKEARDNGKARRSGKGERGATKVRAGPAAAKSATVEPSGQVRWTQ